MMWPNCTMYTGTSFFCFSFAFFCLYEKGWVLNSFFLHFILGNVCSFSVRSLFPFSLSLSCWTIHDDTVSTVSTVERPLTLYHHKCFAVGRRVIVDVLSQFNIIIPLPIELWCCMKSIAKKLLYVSVFLSNKIRITEISH